MQSAVHFFDSLHCTTVKRSNLFLSDGFREASVGDLLVRHCYFISQTTKNRILEIINPFIVNSLWHISRKHPVRYAGELPNYNRKWWRWFTFNERRNTRQFDCRIQYVWTCFEVIAVPCTRLGQTTLFKWFESVSPASTMFYSMVGDF